MLLGLAFVVFAAGTAVIGLAVAALGTCPPELVTSVIAALCSSSDIAMPPLR